MPQAPAFTNENIDCKLTARFKHRHMVMFALLFYEQGSYWNILVVNKNIK